ncbi:MAG: hypothetical protein LBG60_02465, partial [Bifidobacteriaceae bacterium]|nr:hypothetical protein [Bifidobacteriaceae bacterium]
CDADLVEDLADPRPTNYVTTDPSTGLGRLYAVSEFPGACELVALVVDEPSYTTANLPGGPKTLRWEGDLVDTGNAETWFTVSETPIPADGQTTGFITAQLSYDGGEPATGRAASLQAYAEDGAYLDVQPFEEFDDGQYRAYYTGLRAGDYLIDVRADGLSLDVKPGQNAYAHLFQAAPRVPSADQSWASITEDPGQIGSYGQAAGDHGRQIVAAHLRDADGFPVTGAAGRLQAGLRTASDPGGLIGFSDSGQFKCDRPLVDGACLSGDYTVEVYSGVPADRILGVTYDDGELAFDLRGQWGGQDLLAAFTARPADPGLSVLEVTPASPIAAGEAYTAAVALLDLTGAPASQAWVDLYLTGAGCAASFDGQGSRWAEAQSSITGHIAVDFASAAAGTCQLLVYLGSQQVAGSPATVVWTAEPPAPADPDHSTLEVAPDGPAAVGQAYEALVTVRDEFDALVADEPITFALTANWDCPATINGRLTATRPSSAAGEAGVEISADRAGACRLDAYLEDGGWVGSADLVWAWDGPTADAEKSTVVIVPSEPLGDPAGAPVPIAAGDSYQVLVTAYGPDGTTPAPGAEVSVGLTQWSAMSCVNPLVTSDQPGWNELYGMGRTGADGKLALTVSNPNLIGGLLGACVLTVAVEGAGVPRLDADGQPTPSPVLVWLWPPDLGSDHAYYEVSPDDVAADGEATGAVEVQIESAGGSPAMVDLSKLTVSGPAESGLVFGPWAPVQDSPHDLPNGAYQASFTGTKVGQWPVTVAYDGQTLQLGHGANGTAHLVGDGPPVPSADQSSAVVVTAAGLPRATYQHALAAALAGGGATHTIEITLADATGAPVENAAGALGVALADSDRYSDLGSGSYWAGDADRPDQSGKVVEVGGGVYRIAVASFKPGARQFRVEFSADGLTFDLADAASAADPASTVLTAAYTGRAPSAAHSKLVVNPSTPVDDVTDLSDPADGVPDTLTPGGVYEVLVNLRDEEDLPAARGTDPAQVYVALDGPACGEPSLAAGSDGPFAQAAGRQVAADPETGLGAVYISNGQAAVCQLTARVEADSPTSPADLLGSPKTLRWASPPVGSEARSWASVTQGPGQAGVYGAVGALPGDWGSQTVTVAVLDAGGAPLTGAASKLSAVADPVLDPGGVLAFSDGGLFRCVDEPVAGECADGIYAVEVYSGAPVGRVLNVVYSDGSVEFLVSRRGSPAGAKDLSAPFTTGPASAADSTLKVSPDGPLAPGADRYTVTVLVEDRFGNPVEGAPVTFWMEVDPDPQAVLEGGQLVDWSQQLTVYSSSIGSAQAEVSAPLAGSAAIAAFIGPDADGDLIDETDLVWEWPPGPAADPSKTTIVITPSEPSGDPAGVPTALPFAYQATYQIELTAYAEDGVTPVPGAQVYLGAWNVNWAWMCTVSVTEDGRGRPGDDAPDLWGQTGADGKLRATVQNLSDYMFEGTTRVCDLRAAVDGEDILRYGADVDEDGYPLLTLLAWLSPPDPVDGADYNVSGADVEADGAHTGAIDLRLWSWTGPAMVDPSKLTVVVPPESGLTVGRFTALPWENEEQEGWYGGILPSGLYQAEFSGVVPGDWLVEVLYDGQPLAVQSGGNDIAHLVGPDTPPGGPSAAKSTAEVTRTAGQLANRGAPGLAERPEQWGRQTLSVTLVDDADQPVVDAAAALTARASADDPLDGIGLDFGDGGAFACAQPPVQGACPGGVYQLDVYSSKAGDRALEVVYGAGTPDQFTVLTAAGAAALTTAFAVPPADPAASTFVVSPSTPVGDPLGEPDVIGTDERWDLLVTVWDAGRNNLVPDQGVEFFIYGEGCDSGGLHGRDGAED